MKLDIEAAFGRAPVELDIEDDTARFARMTVAERIALFFELCDLTDSIVNCRADRDRLRAAEPVSAETEAALARLRDEARAGR